MRTIILIILLILPSYKFSICQNANEDLSIQKTNSSAWLSLRNSFEEDYQKLDIPDLQLSYVGNLNNIKTKVSIVRQEQYFQDVQKSLSKINIDELSSKDKLDYELIQYETSLNLERIALEKKWIELNVANISDQGLSTIPMGKEWYAYFLKKWVDKEAMPDQMFEFGLKEIERVKSSMKALQVKSGMDSLAFQKHINEADFFYNDVDLVQKAFEKKKATVAPKVAALFPFMDKIPEVKIDKGTNKDFAQVPAFYRRDTFYYNYFDTPYNKRQIGWIYVHEAVPGHHYQLNLDQELPRSSIAKLFRYYGYTEGYAAYIEEIGYEIGAYENIYDELGKWEWDIIRSVRVALDVGLNYYGWSDEEALLFWQQHIQGQDDIAHREIARMKRWPAQVITYKYGANKILKWRSEYEKNDDFSPKEFHKLILQNGSLPFAVLEKELNRKE